MMAAIQQQKQNYRPDELADALGVSLRTVRRWLSGGLISHVHYLGTIRIPREEYERIMRDGLRRKKRAAGATP